MANQVGVKIKEARTAAGLTQAALAEKVEVSANDISKAERGEKELTKDQLKAIAKATGVTQKSLLDAAKADAAEADAAKAEPEKPAITEEELLGLYKSADDDTKNAAIAVLKGEAQQNADPMAAMMGMMGGGEGGDGAAGFDMSSMMSMFGGMMGGGNGEGGESGDGAAGFDMSSMMSMFGGMMGGGNAEGGEAEEKKEE